MGWLQGKGWDLSDAEAEWDRLWKDMIELEKIMQETKEKETGNGLAETRDDGDGVGAKAGAAEDRASGDGPRRKDSEKQSAETAQAAQQEQAEKIAGLMKFTSRYLILDYDLGFIRGDRTLQEAINYACYLSLDKSKSFIVVDTEYAHSKKVAVTYPEIQGHAVAGIYIPNNYQPSDDNIDKLALVQDYMLNASREGHPWPWTCDALAGGEWPSKLSLEHGRAVERKRKERIIAGPETHVRPVYNFPSEDPDFALLWEWEAKSSCQVLRAFDRQDNEGAFPTSMLSVVYELEAKSITGNPVRKILSSEQADRWVMIYVLEWTGMEARENSEKIVKQLNDTLDYHKDIATGRIRTTMQTGRR